MFVWLASIQASNNLDWLDEVSVLPKVSIENNEIKIKDFRNFTWKGVKNSDLNWETREFDLTKLNELYLVVVPFGDSEYMAHTMLIFGFKGQGNLVVSVETRKEKNENYSLVAGALRQLEIIYIFGSDQDLLTLRAVHRDAKLHIYPIKAEPKFMVSLLKDLASSANKLHEKPNFYRTLRDNCTSTLVRHIDRHYQQKIGVRLETIFPAQAGKLLHEFNRMDTQLSYDQAHAVSRIDDLVKQHASSEVFSAMLKKHLTERFAKQ
ncbi:MAG: DUF4105 domain-containing protein [Pseudomonadota bacterium]